MSNENASLGCKSGNILSPVILRVMWLAKYRVVSVVPSRAKEAIVSTGSVISVIDDNALVRAAIKTFLHSRGYVVHTYGSAEEFLGSPYLDDASCVISDVQLPTMTGLELLANMRMRGYAAPFIVITAFTDESVRAGALEAGAICFLAKPFAAQNLITCLDAALQ
ncbi:MAG TPA: response regulator [Steroidobacteraceae bacterium]|nr:response regulator [Steroidobacteraceae bacterium]